jgi:glycosyltransferase involved in cell wall biosynthesis
MKINGSVADLEVAIDARWLHTGLGTYTYNVISRLRQFKPTWSVKAITNRKSANQLAPLCDQIRILDTPIYTLREQWQVAWAARGADLLHVPHYNVPLLHHGKLVVTIHDLIHLIDDRKSVGTTVRAYATIMLNAAARKADHIITVSQFSKTQIVERLAVHPSKISVIPNGVAPIFRLQDGQQPDLRPVGKQEPYLLYVGNLKPHKNLIRLLSAFAIFRNHTHLDWKLLLVGPGGKDESKQLDLHGANLGISNSIFFQNNVAQECLPGLYRKAQLLVLPSLIEGFGLSVVEAMACGTPVACSNASSLPEVAGDAARYFNPLNVEDIASALEDLALSEELRARLRHNGLKRAGQFSWDESARQHSEVFDRVLRN